MDELFVDVTELVHSKRTLPSTSSAACSGFVGHMFPSAACDGTASCTCADLEPASASASAPLASVKARLAIGSRICADIRAGIYAELGTSWC